MNWTNKVIGLLIVLPAMFIGAFGQKPPKPNIVMIMADDLVRYWS